MFAWTKDGLQHVAKNGAVTVVPLHEANSYIAALHASERQEPVPPYPLELAAAVAADPSVKVEADKYPDALKAAVEAAHAKADACLLAARIACEKSAAAVNDAMRAEDSALAACADAEAVLREIRDYAASIRPEPEKPAPLEESHRRDLVKIAVYADTINTLAERAAGQGGAPTQGAPEGDATGDNTP